MSGGWGLGIDDCFSLGGEEKLYVAATGLLVP